MDVHSNARCKLMYFQLSNQNKARFGLRAFFLPPTQCCLKILAIILKLNKMTMLVFIRAIVIIVHLLYIKFSTAETSLYHPDVVAHSFSFVNCFSCSPDQLGPPQEGAARHASVQLGACQCGHHAKPDGLLCAPAFSLLPSSQRGG